MPDKQQLLFAQTPQNTLLMNTVHFNQITDDRNLITDYIQIQARAKG